MDTPEEGGVFTVDVTFPPDYPFQPPHIVFKTRVYDPNISSGGAICLDILKDKWVPALMINKVLLAPQRRKSRRPARPRNCPPVQSRHPSFQGHRPRLDTALIEPIN
jgi:ubiquitin-protein ligase